MSRHEADLQALFDELVEMDDGDRRARLAEIGRKEPALGARLEALLAADAAPSGDLRRPAEMVARSLLATGDDRDVLRPLGRTVGRYRVDDLLGAGGMGVVYRATDLRLHRAVALKLLPAVWSADIRAKERFLREARVAASLDHPNVCTVHEADETADGRLYMTMPLYEGETLRTRLERGPLPVADALDLAGQAARGLAAAHARGLVHRDVKPANLLVTADGTLKVLDFGVAKSPDPSLTTPEQTPGTWAYMAPEQARGATVDARSDVFSLGVVLYEVLTGSRPEAGALAVGRARPPSALRPGVPEPVDALVMAMLAPAPEERPESAAAVLRALQGKATPPSWPQSRRSPAARRAVLAAAPVAAMLAMGWVWMQASRSVQAMALDPHLVVIAPARVTGADPSLAHLREGLVDLLAVKLSGRAGPRAVDSRTSLASWRKAAGDLDRDLPVDSALLVTRLEGAGYLLLVEVVGRLERLTLSARMLDAATGSPGPPTQVTGPTDSLLVLVDRLAAGLLSVGAGEAEERLEQLTSTSLPATLAYLEAQSLSRRGRWNAAVERYQEALRADPTFALAGIGLTIASRWYSTPPGTGSEGLALAWAARDRLVGVDREYLLALAGPNYPEPRPAAERIAAWERLATLAPGRADVWHELGDDLMHYGLLAEAPDALRRAIAAFERALALDPSGSSPLLHLVDLNLYLGELQAARHYHSLLEQVDPDGLWVPTLDLVVAAAMDDSVRVRAVRERLNQLDIPQLRGFGIETAMAAAGFDDAERALRIALERAGLSQDRRAELARMRTLALRRGRPGEALRLADEMERAVPAPVAYLEARILDALFADGDSAAGADAAAALAATVGAGADAGGDWNSLSPRCALEQWKLWHGDASTAPATLALMRAPGDSAETGQSRLHRTLCANLVAALGAHVEGRSDAGDHIDALDAWLRPGPVTGGLWRDVANVTASRLLEAQDHDERALRALRRRYLPVTSSTYVPSLLAEGDLAARTGDRDGAIAAYRRYLAFRSDPEPALQPLAARAREALARLAPN